MNFHFNLNSTAESLGQSKSPRSVQRTIRLKFCRVYRGKSTGTPITLSLKIKINAAKIIVTLPIRFGHRMPILPYELGMAIVIIVVAGRVPPEKRQRVAAGGTAKLLLKQIALT